MTSRENFFPKDPELLRIKFTSLTPFIYHIIIWKGPKIIRLISGKLFLGLIFSQKCNKIPYLNFLGKGGGRTHLRKTKKLLFLSKKRTKRTKKRIGQIKKKQSEKSNKRTDQNLLLPSASRTGWCHFGGGKCLQKTKNSGFFSPKPAENPNLRWI